MKFRTVPLSEEQANRIRQTGEDNFGHEVIEQIPKGKGPCRVSLKLFLVGEDKRLLLSHSPFEIDNAFNQPGPIFIHKKSGAYSNIHRFRPEIKANKENFH